MAYLSKGSSLEAFYNEQQAVLEAKKAQHKKDMLAEKRRAALAQARKVKADNTAVRNFISLITEINVMGVKLENENKIIAARNIYSNMSDEAKANDLLHDKEEENCSYYQDLCKAEKQLKGLHKIENDKQAVAKFAEKASELEKLAITLDNEPQVKEVRKAYLNLSKEAKEYPEVISEDGSLAKLLKAEKGIQDIKDAIKLAHDRAISKVQYEKDLKEAFIRAKKAQQETIKQEALKGSHCDQMRVLLAMVPYIGVYRTNNQALIAEAKKSRKTINYEHIELIRKFFDYQYMENKFDEDFKDTLTRVVKKLTKSEQLRDISLNTIEDAFCNRYYQVNNYFIVPEGAVFSIKRTENGKTLLTLAKVLENFELKTEDIIVLDNLA